MVNCLIEFCKILYLHKQFTQQSIRFFDAKYDSAGANGDPRSASAHAHDQRNFSAHMSENSPSNLWSHMNISEP